FKRPQGSYASLLIEQCGLKGLTYGGAQVSEKHSGFVINKGGATCSDVLTLCRKIQETVREKTGYILELEPIILK
ncbi:MAG: UDP-N-acetylenolpyruvoylglucosamine reductase, partial [Ruminococcus sp.]|nr:UDP-N-acetylenolpyruvoylglucosamine reductase [Ruminococcus sp.]